MGPTATIVACDGWMSYSMHIDGEKKPRRIYWRNHHRSYIKVNGQWVRVRFNYWVADEGIEIPMRYDAEDGTWEMTLEYEQGDNGYVVVETA